MGNIGGNCEADTEWISSVDLCARLHIGNPPSRKLVARDMSRKVGFGMGSLPASLAEAVAAADLVQLRRQRNPEETISRAEAEALLALDRMQKNSAASWRDFIADAIADHLASAEPAGIITPEKADWLIAALAPAGEIETVTAIETLLRAMEAAREVPSSLAVFAIGAGAGGHHQGRGAGDRAAPAFQPRHR